MTTPHPSDERAITDDDNVVIDITDATLAREAQYRGLLTRGAAGDLVIDLRDHVVGTAPLVPRQVLDLRDPLVASRLAAQCPPATGRPADLEPGQRVVRITGGDRWMDAEAFVYERVRTSGTRRVEHAVRSRSSPASPTTRTSTPSSTTTRRSSAPSAPSSVPTRTCPSASSTARLR